MLLCNAKGKLLMVLLVASATAHAEMLNGLVYRVVDGDTLILLDRENRQRTVRLAAIDAPEITQAFGQNAKTGLSALAANQPAIADCRRRGLNGSCLVRIGGKDIGLELVRAGMAWWNPQQAQPQTPQESADYQQAEFNAKIRRFGLWNSKNPTPPWDWRRGAADD